MIDTAGTICAAAEILLDKGATEVWAMAHPRRAVRPSDRPAQKLGPSPGWSSPTPCPSPPEKQIDKIEVLSVAKVFADCIDAVFGDKSVSEIFGGENQT